MSNSLRELIEDRGDRRFGAYYYGFDSTGVEEIDRVLAAVATAGKLAHHTEYWSEPVYKDDISPADFIQKMANEAAEALGILRWHMDNTVVDLREELGMANTYISDLKQEIEASNDRLLNKIDMLTEYADRLALETIHLALHDKTNPHSEGALRVADEYREYRRC